ncbi:MAG: hypothetical protein IMW89_06785 [Ktedonobacteraceae bacterium]|nr:hypothetical protein [Ktedonobacteraceae bacterium]
MKTYRNALITFGLGLVNILMFFLIAIFPVIYHFPYIQLFYLLPPLAAIVMGFVTFFTNKEEPFTGKVRLFLYSGLALGFISMVLSAGLLFYYLAFHSLGSGL